MDIQRLRFGINTIGLHKMIIFTIKIRWNTDIFESTIMPTLKNELTRNMLTHFTITHYNGKSTLEFASISNSNFEKLNDALLEAKANTLDAQAIALRLRKRK